VDHSVQPPGYPYFLARGAGDLPLDLGAAMNLGVHIGVDSGAIPVPPSTSKQAPASTSDQLPRAPELALDPVQVYDSAHMGDAVAVPGFISPPMVGPSS
jgi:hypothetical protein